MRVISGRYRGRRLHGPRGLDLRPTGDKLRETLFDILAPRIHDSLFVDAFAGTGAVGIEALSRGAREVIFIESRRQSLSLIRNNLERCGISQGYMVLEQDVFSALRHLGPSGICADTVFFDPPYQWTPYADLLTTALAAHVVNPDSTIIIEHHRKSAPPESGPGYRLARLVRQGDQCLSFYALIPGNSI